MKLSFLIGYLLIFSTLSAHEPPRKAMMGMLGKPAPGGLLIDSILPGGTFAKLSLQKGDLLVAVNDNAVTTLENYSKIVSSIRTGETLTIKYKRSGKESTSSAKAVMRPFEKNDQRDVIYDWVNLVTDICGRSRVSRKIKPICLRYY